MAHPKLRGFTGIRKDLTVQVEKTVKTKTQVLDKKGKPVIENGKPKYEVKEERIKTNPVSEFVIHVNNAVPFDHKMLH
jgi:hypothetical protein